MSICDIYKSIIMNHQKVHLTPYKNKTYIIQIYYIKSDIFKVFIVINY